MAVRDACREVDGLEQVWTEEDYERRFRFLVNCDPWRDMLFAEVDGTVVGFTRVWWDVESDGKVICEHFAYLHPGQRDTVFRSPAAVERGRLEQVTAHLPADQPGFCVYG